MLENKSKHYQYALFLAPVFLALVGMRFNIAFLAWVVYVPLLVLLRESRTKTEWLIVFTLLQLGFFLQVLKIYSYPIPLGFVPMFSVPAATGSFILLYVYERLRRKTNGIRAVFLFAALMLSGEYLVNTLSGFGTWGTLGYTLIDSQALMQLSSLFGISFVSYFIFLANAFVAHLILEEKRYYKSMLITFLVFLSLYIYGVVRMDGDIDAVQLSVGAVVSDLVITPEGIPTAEQIEQNTAKLFERTIEASRYGAKVVAWNEGATIIKKPDEEAFVKQACQIAKAEGIYLYAAYIVPLDGLKSFENKYIFITQKGEVEDEYYKHFPVPGEAAKKGEASLKVYDVKGLKLGGAICFDYDFIQMGKAHAAHDVGLVAVPSSDWKGIDDYHAKMALVRAIESGHSLLRPARGATSIAGDALGNIRASMSYFEDNDKIMLASVPAKRIVTLYSIVGDIFYYLQMALLVILITAIIWRPEERRGA